MSEFELIIKKLEIVRDTEENGCYICDKEHSKILLDEINKQKEVLDKIKELVNQYEIIIGEYEGHYEDTYDTYYHSSIKEDILELLEEIK